MTTSIEHSDDICTLASALPASPSPSLLRVKCQFPLYRHRGYNHPCIVISKHQPSKRNTTSSKAKSCSSKWARVGPKIPQARVKVIFRSWRCWHALSSSFTAASSRNREIGFPCKGMEIWPRRSEFYARNAWKSGQVHGIPTNKRKQQFLNFHLLPRNQF